LAKFDGFASTTKTSNVEFELQYGRNSLFIL